MLDMKSFKILSLVAIVALLLIVSKLDVYALDPSCTQAEQVRLRQLANATQISYDFYKDQTDDTFGFNVQITNFSGDFYIYNKKDGTYFEYAGSSTVSNNSFAPGLTYQLPFYASENGPCKGYLILTKVLSLPNYNPYSEDALCKDIETYELCKKFTPIRITSYADFKQRVKQYINSLKEPVDETPEPIPVKTKTTWEIIGNFIATYYMFFLIPIIVGATTGIIVIEVKKRRSIL